MNDWTLYIDTNYVINTSSQHVEIIIFIYGCLFVHIRLQLPLLHENKIRVFCGHDVYINTSALYTAEEEISSFEADVPPAVTTPAAFIRVDAPPADFNSIAALLPTTTTPAAIALETRTLE